MAEFYAEKRVVVRPDPAHVARSVASRFLSRLTKRGRDGLVTHVALTGGVMGTAVLRAIAEHRKRGGVNWSLVHFWWTDERFVPRDSDERNEKLASTILFDHIDVPTENIHAFPASDAGIDLDGAAEAYERELARFADDEVGNPWPTFQIAFLGVGADGHIASLFPDRPEIQITDRAAVGVRDSPKPPAERITLTRPVINSSARVWLVLAGTDKASALGLVLAGASYDSVPAAGAKGRKRTIIFVDEAAASQVPPELIDGEY
ncbi:MULTISPECIES: 6-phosphogluconolactonase [unclassified Microbacterium]|uniref:6-phosphogluconolactonase n=1 Tax=unclassified Microbacterium TaxID=2609290 RepID=UPI00214BB8F9|nr:MULTISPECIES: 6-phosphogluconolactonase [unclassified Microbacterium]MCR2785814.1 6-phosphogluconolactonase [Microbacterium sp. zg.B96]MDL5350069.1 6-phosphogluconolactonase [Microbacterium sp. zg-YB36]WIM17207.1 6-phosphogluconolactonase [Microbacterium sp. zg-B96]